jgi:hypothetical protein
MTDMSIFEGLVRFAEGQFEARAARRTRLLLNALPESIQKDIGWTWTPRHRGQHRNGDIGFLGQ